MEAELAAVATVVRSANLTPESRQTLLWCLGRLPTLCEGFARTYESRFAEEIVRLEQGVLTGLAAGDPATTDIVLEHLRTLHEQIGLPAPASAAAPAQRKTRKKSA